MIILSVDYVSELRVGIILSVEQMSELSMMIICSVGDLFIC
jgi:hypothetical protein